MREKDPFVLTYPRGKFTIYFTSFFTTKNITDIKAFFKIGQTLGTDDQRVELLGRLEQLQANFDEVNKEFGWRVFTPRQLENELTKLQKAIDLLKKSTWGK